MTKRNKNFIALALVLVVFFLLIWFLIWLSPEALSESEVVKNSSLDTEKNAINQRAGINSSLSGSTEPNTPHNLEVSEGVEDDTSEFLQSMIERDTKIDSEYNVKSGIEAGFSPDGARRLVQRDGKAIVKMSDLPPIIRETVEKQLKNREEKGYDEVTNEEARLITDALKLADRNIVDLNKISFTPSDDAFMQKLKYLYYGHYYPPGFRNQQELQISNTLNRVYVNEQKEILIIQESSLEQGSATLVEPFVNKVLNGYPASFSNKKSPDRQAYSLLSFAVGDKDFNIFKVDDTASTNGSNTQEAVALFLIREANANTRKEPTKKIENNEPVVSAPSLSTLPRQ